MSKKRKKKRRTARDKRAFGFGIGSVPNCLAKDGQVSTLVQSDSPEYEDVKMNKS
jgi:hypothetical protein